VRGLPFQHSPLPDPRLASYLLAAMLWKPFKLRDADVWARVDASGAPLTDASGRVDVIYKVAATSKIYRASSSNLSSRAGDAVELELAAPSEGDGAAKPKALGKGPAKSGVPAGLPADTIHVWTDGGARPNPGPAAIGVVIDEGGRHTELSEFLGQGTNQTAELTAMLRGLQEVPDRNRTVVVYSDSAYAIGLLSQGWKAKANVELVAELRELCRSFRDLRFVKVLGHSGISLNERTDQLATDALSHRQKRRQLAGSIMK
jgi:ribonuclease HI